MARESIITPSQNGGLKHSSLYTSLYCGRLETVLSFSVLSITRATKRVGLYVTAPLSNFNQFLLAQSKAVCVVTRPQTFSLESLPERLPFTAQCLLVTIFGSFACK